jgi:hypothetical protein
MATTKSILRAFHIFKCKKLDKNINFEMMLKVTSSMSKLMVPYFQPFWTPLLNITSHEEHTKNIIFDMWWTLNFLNFITHNKKL